MFRRSARHPFLGRILLFTVPLLVLFGGCVRRIPGTDCARQKDIYRRDVADARARAGGSEYLLLAQAVELIRKNHIREIGQDNLFLGTIRKCKDSCAGELAISEGADGVRLACGDNAVSVDRPIADDWALEEAFKEVRPVVRECATGNCRDRIDTDYEGFLLETLTRSLDPRGSYWACEDMERVRPNAPGETAQLGLRVTDLGEVNVTLAPREPTPAFKAGVKEGDRIVRIGDRPVEDMTPFELFESEHGVPGTRETIWIMREGFDRPKSITLTREIVKLEDVEALSLEEGIGYIRIHSFDYGVSVRVSDMLHWLGRQKGGLKGLVLDLRSNQGGLVAEVYSVLDRFIDSGPTGVIKTRSVEPDIRNARSWRTYHGFPVAVLVNRYTLSGPEIVARALQENGRGTVVGVPTRGIGSIRALYPLRNGSILMLRTGTVSTGKGSPLDRTGVRPDVVVDKGEAGDAQLDRAVTFLREAVSRAKSAAN